MLKELKKYYVQNQITCPVTGVVLDVDTVTKVGFFKDGKKQDSQWIDGGYETHPRWLSLIDCLNPELTFRTLTATEIFYEEDRS